MYEVLLMITTESNEKIANKISRLLIEKKLAACVSIKRIHSFYEWEDNIDEAEEFEIAIKSKPELKNDLISYLQKMSSYEVPQIIFKKFQTEEKYHLWLTKTI
tara:strand:- start:281 stop:589 length:309 start_codon:yes stop_codon:yes gene_type:complete